MASAFRVVGSAIRQVGGHFTISIVGSLAATVLSIPLLIPLSVVASLVHSLSVVPLGILLLLCILPNPAAAGVQFVARELAHNEPVYIRDHWEGLRCYWVPALKIWVLSVLVTSILLLNTLFYASLRSPIGGLLLIVWLYIFLTWLAAHLYVFPLLLEQKVKRILLVYRNALLMAFSRPRFTLILTPLWIALLLLMTGTGLIAVFGLGLGAAVQQNALARMLPTFEARASD